tara:strand:- start:4116 stop:4586 length:471 start_codon:yes stop_codon:yes gene_type:complete
MRFFFFILVLYIIQGAFSHSGGTDSKGGHWDRKAGAYHYHTEGALPRPSVPNSPKAYSESVYQQKYAKELGGRSEVTLPDGTRCDILTDTHAIEVDFADKWAEAIGQCLNYAMQTGKKPGIVLVLKDMDDERHLERLMEMARYYSMDIDIFPHRAF